GVFSRRIGFDDGALGAYRFGDVVAAKSHTHRGHPIHRRGRRVGCMGYVGNGVGADVRGGNAGARTRLILMSNVTITSTQISITELSHWRALYFAQLREAQDPLLETLVADATGWLIHTRESTVGYALVHPDKGIFEYYMDRSQWAFSTEIFGKFIRQRAVSKALVQSFDDVFFAAA